MTVANRVVGGVISAYSGFSRPGFSALDDRQGEHSGLFFHGLTPLDAGDRYYGILNRWGYHFEAAPTSLQLCPWTDNATDFINFAGSHPEEIRGKRYLLGHSAGGLSVFTFGRIAAGVPLEKIKKAFPGVQLDSYQYGDLQENLQGVRLIGMGTPWRGVKIKPHGEKAAARLEKMFGVPQTIFLQLADSYVDGLYDTLGGVGPEEVIDGNIYGVISAGGFLRRPHHLGGVAITRGGLFLIRSFIDDDGPSDGIVPVSSARLVNVPQRQLLGMDHLHLIEEDPPVHAFHEVVREIEEAERRTAVALAKSG